MIEEYITHPRNHNTDHFVYLVHAFGDVVKPPAYFKDNFVCATLLGKMYDEQLGEIENYSMFGRWGVILDFQDSDVFTSSLSDIGSSLGWDLWMETYSAYGKIKIIDGRELLLTEADHNEVVLKPNAVLGVVFNRSSVESKARAYSKKHKLPIFNIPTEKKKKIPSVYYDQF